MHFNRMFAVLALGLGICLVLGCEGGDDGGGSGSYAGTWSGKVCSRGLTMTLSQSGSSLTGSYALTNPDFSESLSGTVSSQSPPASATLTGGGNRRFEITFSSFDSFSGGYFKGSEKVCDATASK